MRSNVVRGAQMLIAVAFVATILSCDDVLTPRQRDLASNGRPTRNQVSLPTFTITPPPDNSPGPGGGFLTRPTGIRIPAGARYVVTIAGSTEITRNDSAYANCPYAQEQTANIGTWGPLGPGYRNGEVVPKLTNPSGATWDVVLKPVSATAMSVSSDTAITTVPLDLGVFRWHIGGGVSCTSVLTGSYVMIGPYKLNGSLTVSVQAWTGKLTLTRIPNDNVDTNVTVQFSAAVDEAKAVFTIGHWKWKSDTGGVATVSACGSSVSCAYKPATSGTMWVYGTVNGMADSASSHVLRIPCPTQDEFLDRQDVRDALADLWSLSNAEDTDKTKRRERALAMYDSAGKKLIRILALDATSTPCRTRLIEPVPPPGRLLMTGHVHPFMPADTLPGNCGLKPLPPGSVYVYGAGTGGMFSDKDWESTQVAPKHPVFALDTDSIYRADTLVTFFVKPNGESAPDSTWRQNYSSWKRHVSGCSRVRT